MAIENQGPPAVLSGLNEKVILTNMKDCVVLAVRTSHQSNILGTIEAKLEANESVSKI